MTRSAAWILLVLLAAPAAAQGTDDFEQLIEVIEPGDDIRVAGHAPAKLERRAAADAEPPERSRLVGLLT